MKSKTSCFIVNFVILCKKDSFVLKYFSTSNQKGFRNLKQVRKKRIIKKLTYEMKWMSNCPKRDDHQNPKQQSHFDEVQSDRENKLRFPLLFFIVFGSVFIRSPCTQYVHICFGIM